MLDVPSTYHETIVAAMVAAYGDHAQLNSFTSLKLGRPLSHLCSENYLLGEKALAVVQAAETNNFIRELVLALCRDKHTNPEVSKLADALIGGGILQRHEILQSECPSCIPLTDRFNHINRDDEIHTIAQKLSQTTGAGQRHLFVVHGESQQGHDRFISRLARRALPGHFPKAPKIEHYNITLICDSSTATGQQIEEKLRQSMALPDSQRDVTERLALHIAPVLVTVHLSNRGPAHRLAEGIEFWAKTSLAEGHHHPLIVFFCLKYERWKFLGGWRWPTGCPNLNPKPSVTPLELVGVTQDHVEEWVRTHFPHSAVDILTTVPSIFRGFRRRIAMEAAIVRLRDCLKPYIQA